MALNLLGIRGWAGQIVRHYRHDFESFTCMATEERLAIPLSREIVALG